MRLLERELQLAALHDYAADARRGDGRLVLVSGEAGIGKSQPRGRLRGRPGGNRWHAGLVAVEYIVFRNAWRAEHPTGRPELYGQKFEPISKDNRYGIPAFFELHVWAWKKNPSGLFEGLEPTGHVSVTVP